MPFNRIGAPRPSYRPAAAALGALLLGAVLIGCASAPALTDGGSRVRQITAEVAKQCRFVKVVQFTKRVYRVGKDATTMRAIGETGLRNAVATAGGNAYVLVRDDSSGLTGSIAYTGEGYRCPDAVR